MIKKYSAVTIKPCSRRCSFAKSVQGKRFLASEAPILPRCGCKYIHHDDRRDDYRRTTDFGMVDKVYVVDNRRSWSSGRRTADKQTSSSSTFSTFA